MPALTCRFGSKEWRKLAKNCRLVKQNDKKPPDLTPVAFKGAWLINPSQPWSVSLLEQSQDRLS